MKFAGKWLKQEKKKRKTSEKSTPDPKRQT